MDFRKTLPFKSYGVKKPICKKVRAHCERFHALSGPAKSRNYLKDNRPVYQGASEASYWFSWLKTMDIVTVYNVRIEFGNEGCGRERHVRTCLVPGWPWAYGQGALYYTRAYTFRACATK